MHVQSVSRVIARRTPLAVALGLALALGACSKGQDNEIKGAATEAKGNVESAVGGAVDSDSMKAEGKKDELKGKVQKKTGQVEQSVDKTVDKIKP